MNIRGTDRRSVTALLGARKERSNVKEKQCPEEPSPACCRERRGTGILEEERLLDPKGGETS